MNSSLHRILYKLLIVSMINITLIFFCAGSVSHAKLKLKDGEFYYSGTQEAQYNPEKGFWETLLEVLSMLANYLLGIMTLGIRGVIVGWIEVMEIILTALLGVETDMAKFFGECITNMNYYTQNIVNIEKIIFNEVDILDANIFKLEE